MKFNLFRITHFSCVFFLLLFLFFVLRFLLITKKFSVFHYDDIFIEHNRIFRETILKGQLQWVNNGNSRARKKENEIKQIEEFRSKRNYNYLVTFSFVKRMGKLCEAMQCNAKNVVLRLLLLLFSLVDKINARLDALITGNIRLRLTFHIVEISCLQSSASCIPIQIWNFAINIHKHYVLCVYIHIKTRQPKIWTASTHNIHVEWRIVYYTIAANHNTIAVNRGGHYNYRCWLRILSILYSMLQQLWIITLFQWFGYYNWAIHRVFFLSIRK